MRKQNLKTDYVFDLINAFRLTKSADETVLFLQDIMTANEIKNLSLRLQIAKLLMKNKTQRDICMSLSVSLATVSKVNSWLTQKGEGFRKIILRLPLKYAIPTKIPKGPLEYHLPEVLIASTQYLVASGQNRVATKLISELKNKTYPDKHLRETTSDFYKHKHK